MPKQPSSLAAAVDTFIGLRIELPRQLGTFVCRKPLFFEDGLRWQELWEEYQLGVKPYSATLKVIVGEMQAKCDPENWGILNGITLGEFCDYVVLSFFSHRPSVPGWLAAMVAERLPAPAEQTPASPPAATPSPQT